MPLNASSRRGSVARTSLAVNASALLPQDLSDIQKTFESNDCNVLPAQQGQSFWRPPHEMISQMLTDALNDAALEENAGMRLESAYKVFMTQRRALGWIFSRGEHVFGFEWCCQHVNVDPGWVRKKLLEECPRAQAIDEHLKDPEKVPAPPIPRHLWVAMKRSRSAEKRVEQLELL